MSVEGESGGGGGANSGKGCGGGGEVASTGTWIIAHFSILYFQEFVKLMLEA